jgi:hypothetical protein
VPGSEIDDHFMCPRCGGMAPQRWLTRAAGRPTLRWSACQRCHQIAIWRGPVVVYPPMTASAVAGDVHALLRMLTNDAAAARRLLRLWAAVRLHLAELARVRVERE